MWNLKWLLPALALTVLPQMAAAQFGQPPSNFGGYSPGMGPRQPAAPFPAPGFESSFHDGVMGPQYLQGGPSVPPPNSEFNPPQIDPEVLRNLGRTPTIPPVHLTQEKPVTVTPDSEFPTALRWIIPAILAALGSMGGKWGMRQELPPQDGAGPQTPPQEPLGLGPDGRDGVWLREVPAWENKGAPRSK
jgi:hypothetical protein